MVTLAKGFGKEMRRAQRTRRSVMGLLALMCAAGCAMLSLIPDLDTPMELFESMDSAQAIAALGTLH